MTREDVLKGITDFYHKPISKERVIKIYTGVGGIDLIEERLDEHMGFERIMVGKKVLRLLRKLKPIIRKNKAGKYYRLMKTDKWKSISIKKVEK